MPKIKIAMIAKENMPKRGGFGRHVHELSKALNELEDVEVTLFTRSGRSLKDSDVEVRETPWLNLGNEVISSFTAYPAIISRIKDMEKEFDLIHGHALEPFPVSVARKMNRLDIPFVYTLHGIGGDHVSREYLKPLAKFLHKPEKYMVRNADRVIAVSEHTRKEALDQYKPDPERITAINNGVDIEKFSSEYEFDNKILFVGHMVSRKGPDILLDAFSKLEDEDLELVYVGDGRMKKELQEKVEKKNLGTRVSFKSGVSDEELRELYSESILVLPSAYEGFGMVYVEAMASRAPVIATKDTAIESLIDDGENGFLCERDSETIADTLEELIEDKELIAEISENARANAENFDWINIAQETREVYRKALD